MALSLAESEESVNPLKTHLIDAFSDFQAVNSSCTILQGLKNDLKNRQSRPKTGFLLLKKRILEEIHSYDSKNRKSGSPSQKREPL